jgi:serine/threonine protein kinase
MLEIVAYLHAKGVCHRDIKPENLMVDTELARVFLIDFGISKQFRKKHETCLMISEEGTMAYQAP